MFKHFLLTLLGLLSFCFGNVHFIGRDPTWYPTPLYGKAELINGFTNALFQKVSAQQKYPMQLTNTNSGQLFDLLENGTFQGVLSTISPSEENQKKYQFSDPILLLGPVLVVMQGSSYRTVNDFSERIIGLNPSDRSVLLAQKNPTTIIRYYENLTTALEDLQTGKIDGVLMPMILAHSLIPSQFPHVHIVTVPLNEEGIRLISLHEQSQPIVEFNKGLEELKQSGHFNQLKKEFSIP